ncbi:MAG: MarR family winged helix-turn-helix transcriptional regulator [Campylobacteraceae bacterium]|jgi:DNA-binding MarR family transcriptional regulator|nr:MarR family winged helix-turn-helix transcriptional regulator [Campylobacteraceae bacterium]
MDRKIVVELIEKNHAIMHKLAEKMDIAYEKKYSRHKMLALMWLGKNGKKRLKEIAAQTGMSSSSLCVMFNEMEKENLVVREIDKTDRRNTYYFLSENGEIAADNVIKEIKATILQILEPLKEDEVEDIAEALSVINKILEKYL